MAEATEEDQDNLTDLPKPEPSLELKPSRLH